MQGSDGDFYGTTPAGGAVGPGTVGPGTVFKVTPAGTLTTLHSFSGGSDGYAPYTGLEQGSDGDFYGTTSGFTGIPRGVTDGTIYRITPAGVLTTLYTFSGTAANALVQGSDGNFYGTTTSASAGANKYGSIFVITPAGVLTTLHAFADTNDQRPTDSLVEGGDGDYYGTSLGFGDNRGAGSVFKISPTGTFTKLYDFTGDSNGGAPNGSLVLGNDGNFYGTTQTTVFKITPAGLLTTLHTFTGSDGKAPVGLSLAVDGNFYGTTRREELPMRPMVTMAAARSLSSRQRARSPTSTTSAPTLARSLSPYWCRAVTEASMARLQSTARTAAARARSSS